MMRNWIILVEAMSLNALDHYLKGDFYHGTAREDLAFGDRAAYFTQDEASARAHAKMDAEIEGGTPHVLRVRLHCTNPAVLDVVTMQDLHLEYKQGELVRNLIEQGHDCAVGNVDGHDEIVVLDKSKIEVLEATDQRS